jgi:hypothetical protein
MANRDLAQSFCFAVHAVQGKSGLVGAHVHHEQAPHGNEAKYARADDHEARVVV